jgi:surfactin synthase thioesterase subunit
MKAPDSTLQSVVDELANALQATVVLAEYLQLAASAGAQDATALARSLRRATAALQKLRVHEEPSS